MKILFLSQLLPYPLDSGVKFRMYYTLRQLASQHEVTLACFVRPDNTPAQVAHLEQYCRAVHTVTMPRSALRNAAFLAESVLFNRSFIIVRDRVKAMQALIARLLSEAEQAGQPFEAVHCDQLWMAQYALPLKLPKLLDQHNAVYLIPQRMAQHEANPLKRLFLQWESRKLRRYEAEACRRFDHVLAVTEQDRALIQALIPAGGPPVTCVPICLDPEEIRPAPRSPQADKIVSLGTMFWPPNVDGVLWFAREILPRVRARVPAARLVVAGKNPPPEVQALAALEGVEIAGYVADPEPLLSECAAFIVPLRAGGGMRVKIVDGWLRGLPVVSTTIGAEGIAVIPGENILIADEPEAFASCVADLLENLIKVDALARNGRAWAEMRYNWRKIYPVLNDIYTNLK